MARNRSKRKGSNETRWSREAMGVLLAGTGVLLLLSLVSYTPGDLPIKIPFTDWALLSGFALDLEANNPRENWIGPIGTLLGFIQIQIFAWVLLFSFPSIPHVPAFVRFYVFKNFVFFVHVSVHFV